MKKEDTMSNKIHEPTPLYRAMMEKRRSNATVPVDPTPKKMKTRAGKKKHALKDWE